MFLEDGVDQISDVLLGIRHSLLNEINCMFQRAAP